MSTTPKHFKRNVNLNGNEMEQVKLVKLLEDASTADSAVRLSQAENIAEAKSQNAAGVAKAEAILIAANQAGSMVFSESQARAAEISGLNTKVDNLAKGDIVFVGHIGSDGNVTVISKRIAAGDTRDGDSFASMDLVAAEVFVFSDDATITYPDGTEVSYRKGDQLMLLDDVDSGNLVESDTNFVSGNETGLDVSNVGSSTVEIDEEGNLTIKDGSIGLPQLAQTVKDDIDSKMTVESFNAKIFIPAAFNVPANGSLVIDFPTGFDTSKMIYQIFENGEESTSTYSSSITSDNMTVYNESIASVTLELRAFSLAV